MKKWTEEEIEWLKENYAYSTKSEIENRFSDKSYHQIQVFANSIGLKRIAREGKIFYKEDLQWLKENYSILPICDYSRIHILQDLLSKNIFILKGFVMIVKKHSLKAL